jgi:hypothetical protein
VGEIGDGEKAGEKDGGETAGKGEEGLQGQGTLRQQVKETG